MVSLIVCVWMSVDVCMYELEKLSKLIFRAKVIKNSFVFFLEFFLNVTYMELLKCSLGSFEIATSEVSRQALHHSGLYLDPTKF